MDDRDTEKQSDVTVRESDTPLPGSSSGQVSRLPAASTWAGVVMAVSAMVPLCLTLPTFVTEYLHGNDRAKWPLAVELGALLVLSGALPRRFFVDMIRRVAGGK